VNPTPSFYWEPGAVVFEFSRTSFHSTSILICNTNQEQKPLLGPEKFFDLDTPLKCSESPLSIPLSGVVTERESSKNCQSFNGHV
jgi:hypothetical protein